MMSLDNGADGGEAQSRARAGRFRGEKGLEHLLLSSLGNAGPIVLDFDLYRPALIDVLCSHGYPLLQGISNAGFLGIEQQMHEGELKLSFLHMNRRHGL